LREVQDVDERYRLETGTIYLTGLQALVRLLLLQAQRDRDAGLNTAGFVSGYRGSPLGGIDQEFWRARAFLERVPIHFQPGVNEELAATAVWGTQQINLFPASRHDGVFGFWYGKGPGVDRSGDAFKHANFAGTAKHGGVLVAAGDDHVCKSSTLPQQSEYGFIDAMIPLLNPTDVQDVLELGLMGYGLSRFSGCWVGLKMTEGNADSSQTVLIPRKLEIVQPEFEVPEGGLHIRWPDEPNDQEYRLQHYKIYAALAFARANQLNRVVIDGPRPRFGIVSTGKAYLDVLQALEDLGIDKKRAGEIGIKLFKVGMSWPLEPEGIRDFARGLEEILVVEEKRAVVESQLKEQLYNWEMDSRPLIVGKFDERGEWILPSSGDLTPTRIARVIANRLSRFHTSPDIEQRVQFLERQERLLEESEQTLKRLPHFCSGCPHNTSTRVPKGSRAIAGIGCHFMAVWMDRDTATFTQMGGEGATWLGQAPFTDTSHVFQNLGDGTYAHSGLLAVRAAVAAGVNMTYKILYNDAVAMTGGQPVEGGFSVAEVAAQLSAEGVKRIVVVTDQLAQYSGQMSLPAGVSAYHRRELNVVQRELREVSGVSALIYDQTCAAELRRRRRRNQEQDPARWVTINPLVCEGCGDCNAVSNCLSVVQLETEFGRKRAINQSACNKDFSCLEGFCPSFVVLEGVTRKASEVVDSSQLPDLPEPQVAQGAPYNVLISGIGGTGVSTLGAILGMAAHLEGRCVMALDQTGLAQKFGAVLSHVRIGANQEHLHSPQIPVGSADLLLGADLIVATHDESLAKLSAERTSAVVNTHEEMPAAFISNRDLEYQGVSMLSTLARKCRGEALATIDATALATALLGDSIFSNLFLLGVASQKGLLPVSATAIEQAIELNIVALEQNRTAFRWGRHAALDPELLERFAEPVPTLQPMAETLDEVISCRERFLEGYQSTKYASRYRALVERVKEAEGRMRPGSTVLADTVARSYFKLLAYKDEYEVARLHAKTTFLNDARSKFAGKAKLKFYLSPPLIARLDPETGRPRKYEFGGWILPVFRVLASLSFLRGTPLDPFGYSAERRADRRLIVDFESLLARILEEMDPSRLELAIELARLPQSIRGYGPVKQIAMQSVETLEAELLEAWSRPEQVDPPRMTAA
jgi:indolepyruvate ferredoxin oxidoreductase